MSLPNNYKKYPENMEAPYQMAIENDEYIIHSFRFRGMQDFYDFLKSDPPINSETFSKKNPSSVSNGSDFAGVSYEKAIEKLTEEMDPGYQEYLSIQKNIKAITGRIHKYKNIKTIAGGFVDPVAYTVGSPEIYRASRIHTKPKFVTIDTQVAYHWRTSKKQVFHRALIITNLIRALERNGYSVNVNSFMVAEEDDEIIKATFEIKKQGKQINYQSLYKSLVDVEFFRRLCFRVMEVSDVENDWYHGYGRTSRERTVRPLLKLRKEDIYFDQPENMGIDGDEIGKDFENAIHHLDLEKVIDIPREKEILRESVKVLKR